MESALDNSSKSLLMQTIGSLTSDSRSNTFLQNAFLKPDSDTINILHQKPTPLSPSASEKERELKPLARNNSLFNFSPLFSRRGSCQSDAMLEFLRPLEHRRESPKFDLKSPFFRSANFPGKGSHHNSTIPMETEESNGLMKNISPIASPHNCRHALSSSILKSNIYGNSLPKKDGQVKESEDENNNNGEIPHGHFDFGCQHYEFPPPSPGFLTSHKSYILGGPHLSRFPSLTLDTSLIESDDRLQKDEIYGETPNKKVKKQ